MGLLLEITAPQQELAFPVALTERYRPKTIDGFIGLEKPKAWARNLAARPYSSAWRLVGAPGTGKTSMALALAHTLGAELHHIPSQKCDLATIDRECNSCRYVPLTGGFHLILADEADEMTYAAQTALLSRLDETNRPPQTIFIFTCNSTEKLQERFLDRTREVAFSSHGAAKDVAAHLESIWQQEAPATATVPNFARIVSESAKSIRGALNRLESELMFA
jgi:DNA polymerase III delta prime subunit